VKVGLLPLNASCRERVLSDRVTRHHLKRLQSFGFVVAQDHAGTVRYFENHGRYAATWKNALAMRDPNLRRLMERLGEHPDQSQQELSDALGAARSVVQRRLRRLENWGLVSASRNGRAGSWQKLMRRHPVPGPCPQPKAPRLPRQSRRRECPAG
jgi:predicted transcriptional regulator